LGIKEFSYLEKAKEEKRERIIRGNLFVFVSFSFNERTRIKNDLNLGLYYVTRSISIHQDKHVLFIEKYQKD
jgi:hypothetical protein